MRRCLGQVNKETTAVLCRVCDSSCLIPVLDLGNQPWANQFLTQSELGTEQSYELRLVLCEECRSAQLDHTVPKEIMFSDHTYLSGTTDTLRRHFYETARYIDQTYLPDKKSKRVLDIGSNDGTQLIQYKKLGYQVFGVDSCRRVAEIAREHGVPTEIAFFNETWAGSLNRRFEVISASGVFFHLEELHSVTRGIKRCLAPDGVFVVQFLYLLNMLENVAFDQIYHEHLLYYSLRSITLLLSRHGLAPVDAYLSGIHGGSVVMMVRHAGTAQESPRLKELRAKEEQRGLETIETYRRFARNVKTLKQRTLTDLSQRKKQNKTIYGLGAPVKGNTLLNTFGVGRDFLDLLCERNPLRSGLYSPGQHIPILLESELPAEPDVYFVLAWNFKEEILQRYSDLVRRGVEFYFPIESRVPC